MYVLVFGFGCDKHVYVCVCVCVYIYIYTQNFSEYSDYLKLYRIKMKSEYAWLSTNLNIGRLGYENHIFVLTDT